MATISTSQTLDSAARTAGEAMTITNGAVFTIDTDTRYHKNAPASGTGSLGSFTMTSATGGEVLVDGRNVRWIAYTSGSGNVPAYDTIISGATASGLLAGVYTAVNAAPTAVGTAMPASGFLKFKSVTSGPFSSSEAISGTDGTYTLNATTNGTETTGWLEIVCDDGANITIGRAQKWTTRAEWFYLDNTNGSRGQTIQLPTCGGGANTRYAGIWIETGVGTNEYEFWPAQRYSAALASGWYSTAKGTDARSKFVEMQDGGVVRIGSNASGDYGALPDAGCKTRIPNLLFVACATGSRASNALPNATVTSRPEFTTTSAGNIDANGGMWNWYFNIGQAYSFSLQNSAVIDNIVISEVATSLILNNVGTGNYLNTDVNNVSITSCLAGGKITDCKFGRTGTMGSADYGTAITYCKDITLTDCHFQNRIFRTNGAAYPLYIAYCDNIQVIRPTIIGGAYYATVSTNNYVEDPVYADSYHTTSSATTPPAGVICFGAGAVNNILKGGSFWNGIDNVHPDTAFLYLANASNTRWYNCGSYDSPITGGSSNAMLYAVNDAGNSLNTEIKRVYFTSLGTRFVNGVNSSKGLVIENCSGNYGTNTTNDILDVITKGFGISAMDTAYTSVYGTIFYNIFTSATVGRVGLVFNEETSTYASYVNKTGLTGASGFDSTGKLYLYNLNDVIEYEFPYYILGYTSFAASNVVKGGSGTANLGVKYQIDVNDGNGYNGTWKDATSANLSAETISATNGFKLKIQITCTTAGTNYLNSLYFSMVTNSTDQYTNYPLDVYTLTLTGLQTGTRVAILETGTETLLELLTESGGSVSYTYPDSDVGDRVDIAILAAGYLYQKITNYTLTDADASVPIVQNEDYGYVTSSSEAITFNGSTKRIICDVGTTSIDVVGMYSMWVDWALTSDNLKYNSAFSELGGNTIDSGAGTSVPVYTFLVNGWRVAPDEADHTLAVTGGIILVDGGGDPFVDTSGAYTVRINYQQPVQAITVSTGGGGATAAEVWSYTTRKLTGTKQSFDDLNDISTTQVNTEVDTALADYDAPTKAELDSAQSAIQNDIAAVPTAGENADAIWDEAVSSHVVAGSASKLIQDTEKKVDDNQALIISM